MTNYYITDEELRTLNQLITVIYSNLLDEETVRIRNELYPVRMWRNVNGEEYTRRDHYDSIIRNNIIKERVEEISQILAIVKQRNQSQGSNQNQQTSQPNRFADIDIV